MNNLQAKEIIAEARYSKNRGKHCKDFGRKWSPDVKTNLMVKMLMEWNVWVVDDPPPFLYGLKSFEGGNNGMTLSSDVGQVESLKKSTRHETVNSTSRNDEKSRTPGEQHSEHSKRSF
uniref:DUF4283 domain-containing protein n=3 Tax=Bursaphelenchus xylophilus TaxID=6326 RepID=A0A1I7SPU7_BURXY